VRKKVRKPKNFRLHENYELEASHRGQALFYLKPNPQTYIWIDGRKKLADLIKWLKRVERYSKR
jgi:hypothetical protein